MNASSPAPFEALKPLPDEELLDLARRAYAMVIIRALDWIMRLVRALAPSWLQEADIQDAEESVVAALMVALPTYDVNQWRTDQRCAFRTFAENVVKRRFINILKRHGWLKRHQLSEEEMQKALDRRAEDLNRTGGEIRFTESGLTDPALIAEVHERWERLQRILAPLHPQAWPLWQEICAGIKLSVAARKLGIKYKPAQRLTQRMFVKALEVIGEDR